VARSFSGDKEAAGPDPQGRNRCTKGFAFVDVISPCVTFNDHEGSTKSYRFTREHMKEVVHADFVPPATRSP
jgi:2-oxoglutarate/2-oxoacid ferredoxin oxidoreductase subunit beta